jgi:putative transposase
MKKYGLRAISPKRNLSKPSKGHKIYPYLLKNKNIWLPNHAWAADITYVTLQGCHVYLVAIIDICSRKVLSNTLDTSFCIEVLEEAIEQYGVPCIFNTDQGSQFTSNAFTNILKEHGIAISMDSVGRAIDNIYIERLWRSVKYEEIYLKDYENLTDLKISINKYFDFYNTERFHQSLEYATPDEEYYMYFKERIAA